MQMWFKPAVPKRWVSVLSLASAIGFASAPAIAMRPFDGTDATVADKGMFELELGGGYLRQTGGSVRTLPFAVFNLGIGADTELVAEGRVQTDIDRTAAPYRTGLHDTQISVKHVFRHGSLQEGGSGVSFAVECSGLLPGYHGERGSGGECAAIASQRFAWGDVHLNLASERGRERHWGHFRGLIVEGPDRWTVQPVVELTHERVAGEPSANGRLAGVVWRLKEELALDLAGRRVHSDGAHLTEFRFGVTWGLKM